MRTLLAWGLGIPNTVFWGTLSLLGSLVDGSGAWAHRCMVRWSRINLRLAGVRVAVSGLEHVARDRGQVLAANHQSLVDILVLAATLPVPFRFVAKQELFSLAFLGWHMSRAGFIAIDRGRPRAAAKALLAAAERIRSGTNALVFPEGTRSPDGRLLPFRSGAFLLAIRAGAPVVPMALVGTGQVVRKGSRRVHPATVSLIVLPPLEAAGLGDDRERLAEATRAAIAAALPAETPAPPEAAPA